MARNLLTVIFLFLFVLPVYAGKPVPPVAVAVPAINIAANSAEIVCSVTAGSEDAYVFFVRESPAPSIGLTYFSVPASSVSVNYTFVWQGLQPNSFYAYSCYASSSVGTSSDYGVIQSFTTLPSISDPPTCILTANPSIITSGSSTTITFNSALADTFQVARPGYSMSVTPNVQGSFPDSLVVTTTYTGTVTNNGGVRTCNVTVTVGNVPPQSVTVGATLSPSYNGFNFQCSNMYGTTPTRLFMRLTANGITKDYNYVTVPPPGTFFEFWHYQTSSYEMYTESVEPSPFIPLILDLNTLYSYQCCSENSFGSSCGDTGSIYTAPYALSFNYDYAPDWPRSVSYGAQSLWAMTINSPYVCPSVGFVSIYYLSGSTIQNVYAWDLFYSFCPSCPPSFNASSNFAMWDLNHNGFLDAGDDYNYWNSHSDAFCWDINKDGILDTINACNGRNICGVVYFQGQEHFFDCPAGGVSGKPLYATAYVGGFSDSPFQMCPQVPFPFGTARAGVRAKNNAAIIRHSSVGGRGRGQGRLGMGGYERIE